MGHSVGYTFTTGNSVVKTLPEGTILEVSGAGKLTVSELPQGNFEAGDRINTKYGPATVLRLTSRLSQAQIGEDQVLYVADNDPVARIASRDLIEALDE